MNSFTFDLPLSEEVEICPLADVHIGNPLCDEQAFKKTIDYILEEPTNPKRARVCILNGDLTESVTKHSKGNTDYAKGKAFKENSASLLPSCSANACKHSKILNSLRK